MGFGTVEFDYPFRNTSLDWDSRVDDLVNRLTLQVRYLLNDQFVC